MPTLPTPRNRKEAEANREYVRAMFSDDMSLKQRKMEEHGWTEEEYKEWLDKQMEDLFAIDRHPAQ